MKFKDAIEIARPINCLMGAISVIIGLLNTRLDVSFERLAINILLGFLTYFLIAASGMVINDVYDIEIDKINRPERPIPRGSITLMQAKILFIMYFCCGLFLSALNTIIFNLNILNFVLASIFRKLFPFRSNISILLIYESLSKDFPFPSLRPQNISSGRQVPCPL